MEQRIGSSSQPLEGAGFDPAFIPGLTSPGSGEKEDVKPAAEAEPGFVDADEEPPPAPGASGAEASPEEAAADASEEAPEAPEDGPVFEAADRRAKVVADHSGVRLALDDQACEFRWDEIGAVETETARFGKRFTVTVHTHDRRWYYVEVEAVSRGRFAEWESELDAVLDAYFEDGDTEEKTAEPEDKTAEPEEETAEPEEKAGDAK
ncbi:hypothetical protein [Streptomyces sp. CRN 30]|uniref:hypothetical protein n=1 Tax=Streptomyces sp. CRN 30 TaxID=3075613 RepID=UPI002A7FD275|nr:hypothetical protein [Streptomyces sp. CRN 30]